MKITKLRNEVTKHHVSLIMKKLFETLLKLQEEIPFNITINNKNKTIVIQYGTQAFSKLRYEK